MAAAFARARNRLASGAKRTASKVVRVLRRFGLIDRQATLLRRKAETLWSANDRAKAQVALQSALALAPNDPKLIAKLARMEMAAGRHAEAESRLRQALEQLVPQANGGAAWRLLYLLTGCLLDQRKSDDALDLLASAQAARLAREENIFLRAHIYRYTRRYSEAEHLYRECLAVKPDDDRVLRELAELVSLQGRFAEAESLHQQLVQATDDPAANAQNWAYRLLAQGRVREGWAHNMLRAEHAELKKLKGIRVWGGSDLSGRSIFVIVEGGTGDELRDAVCYQELASRAAHVTIACDPRLKPLLTRSFPKIRFWPLRRQDRVSVLPRKLSTLMDDDAFTEARRHDFSILSPDLFYFLKPDIDDYGRPVKYLVPDPSLVSLWRQRLSALGSGAKIGISWTSIRQSYRTHSCYTALAEWGPILTTPATNFISLQYGEVEQEIRAAEQTFGVRIHRWPDLNLRDDFDSVAAIVSSLDLVLAPNNTTLELAGALGAPAGYMVNEYHPLDYWRLKDRSTGEDRCYRSVRIFMAEQPGNSASLIAQVAATLAQR